MQRINSHRASDNRSFTNERSVAAHRTCYSNSPSSFITFRAMILPSLLLISNLKNLMAKRFGQFGLLYLLLAGCGQAPSPDAVPMLPTTTMQIGTRQFTLEKATTMGQQNHGLMRRDSMAADHGMIFIFAQAQPQTFWNHDVRFGIDNLFLDSGGRIVSIEHMDAYDEHGTPAIIARYVIELNTGIPKEVGVKVGDTLTIPPDAVAP
jgi:uncharacterized membrane protein (UPF0127 family)